LVKRAIDTNILLDHTFEQIISQLKTAEPLELLIPLQVVKELDSFKVGMETINVRARHAIRFIESARLRGKLTTGVDLGDGVSLRVVTSDWLNQPGEKFSPDIRILEEILTGGLANQKGEDVQFISSDVHARILSDVFGLDTAELPMEIPDVPAVENKLQLELTDAQLTTLYRNYKTGLPLAGLYQHNDFIEMVDSTGTLHHGVYDGLTGSIKRLNDNYEAWSIKPRTNESGKPIPEQALLMHHLLNPQTEFVSAIGSSGCGKTFLTLACALEQTMGKNPVYKKIIVMRPLAAIDRDLGALPGDKVEKLTPWLGSVIDNLTILMDKKRAPDLDGGKCKDDSAYMSIMEQINYLIADGKIELEALTYIRGRSIPNSFIIIEDAQNCTPKEAATIVTRVGEGSKLVFLGDVSPAQIDNPRLNQYNNGLTYVANKLYGVDPSVACLTMNKVVRSKLASLGVDYL
jgi:PhoH-like ATPase